MYNIGADALPSALHRIYPLLNLLVREARAQTILEVGASYGYSTVWLAEAARPAGVPQFGGETRLPIL